MAYQQQQVGYPQQGYPQQGYPQQGYPQQGYAPQAVAMGSPVYTGVPVTTISAGGGVTVAGAMPGTVVVMSGPPPLGFESTPCVCPNCRAQITTAVAYTPGLFTWLLVAGLCFVGCVPCCLIPFCIPSCQDSVHSCPNCQYTIGTKTRA